MNKGLYALAAGTFGLGIVEYVMMGILPDMAAGLDISITQAGHLISAYALGVCFGAPLIAMFAKNWPLRKILVMLIFLFAFNGMISFLLMCVATACLFAVSSPQQQLLLQYSPGGEMMGGAMVQLAFNLGNAVGAFFGGIPIDAGAGVEYTALAGAGMALAGVSVLVWFNRGHRYKLATVRVR